MNTIAKLAGNAEDLAKANRARNALLSERAALVHNARHEGVTWRDIEAATGITRSALLQPAHRTKGQSA